MDCATATSKHTLQDNLACVWAVSSLKDLLTNMTASVHAELLVTHTRYTDKSFTQDLLQADKSLRWFVVSTDAEADDIDCKGLRVKGKVIKMMIVNRAGFVFCPIAVFFLFKGQAQHHTPHHTTLHTKHTTLDTHHTPHHTPHHTTPECLVFSFFNIFNSYCQIFIDDVVVCGVWCDGVWCVVWCVPALK